MKETNLQAVSQIINRADTNEMDGKYLTFWTDGQLFGIPIAHVVQIVGMQPITNMPEFPSYAKGIISLRGSIIPLISMCLRLGKMERDYNERTCIIVTNINERFIGFIVDEVDSVTAISDESITPPPHLSTETDGYIIGIGKLENTIVLIMDTRKVLGTEELSQLVNQ